MVLVLQQHLRSDLLNRPAALFELAVRNAAEAPVYELELGLALPLFDEDVFGFDVPVGDLVFVRLAYCADELVHYGAGLKFSVLATALDQLRKQVAAVADLGDDVLVLVVLVVLLNFDYVRVVEAL